MIDVPCFALPLRLDVSGRTVVVEQDSPDHVGGCVEAAARTRLGDLVESPDFGIPSYVMQTGGADIDELRAALTRSVPAAAIVAHRIESPDDLRADRIRVLLEQEGA